MDLILKQSTKNTLVQPFGLVGEESPFQRISTIEIPENSKVHELQDGTEFQILKGTFIGTTMVSKAKLLKKEDGTPFAVTQSAQVGVISIDGKNYKLSSSDKPLKIGDVYAVSLRTSKKVEIDGELQFKLKTSDGTAVKWLVIDSKLTPSN